MMTMWLKRNALSPFLGQLERGEREEETYISGLQRQNRVGLEKEGAYRKSSAGWTELEWGGTLPCRLFVLTSGSYPGLLVHAVPRIMLKTMRKEPE